MNTIKIRRSFGVRVMAVILALVSAFIGLTGCSPSSSQEENAGSGATDSSETSRTLTGIQLEGIPIEDYEIKYEWREKNGERETAEYVQAVIEESFGVSLPVSSDYACDEGRYIFIGNSSHGTLNSASVCAGDTEYAVRSDRSHVYLLGNNRYGLQKAAHFFVKKLSEAHEQGNKIVLDDTNVRSFESDLIRSMTFNIYNWDTSREHLARILSVLKEYEPDSIGFQEITETWINRMMADEKIASQYAWVGEDRGDSTHERSAIFYRKDRFRLCESGTKWLSDTPDRAGSHFEGAGYCRVFTYAVLERIEDGKKFLHINTHLDFGNDLTSAADREALQKKQIDVIMAFVTEQKKLGYDIILTGDFNANSSSVVYREIVGKGFVNTRLESKQIIGTVEPINESYNGEADKHICYDIDFIFGLSSMAYYHCFTVCDKKYNGGYPSDHLPQMVTFAIG